MKMLPTSYIKYFKVLIFQTNGQKVLKEMSHLLFSFDLFKRYDPTFVVVLVRFCLFKKK